MWTSLLKKDTVKMLCIGLEANLNYSLQCPFIEGSIYNLQNPDDIFYPSQLHLKEKK